MEGNGDRGARIQGLIEVGGRGQEGETRNGFDCMILQIEMGDPEKLSSCRTMRSRSGELLNEAMGESERWGTGEPVGVHGAGSGAKMLRCFFDRIDLVCTPSERFQMIRPYPHRIFMLLTPHPEGFVHSALTISDLIQRPGQGY